MNNASQSCQDFSCHMEISALKQKKNDRLISKKNISKCEAEKDVLKDGNTASHKSI